MSNNNTGATAYQTAWLVELRGDWPSWFFLADGIVDFTTDANRAIKFTDKSSADQAVRLCQRTWASDEDKVDIFTSEHCWPDGY